MASKLSNNEDESFIILGTSPGTSMDIKCNGVSNGDVSLNKSQIEDALKEFSAEANMAFKAHFKLGDCPSPASMMVASNIISDDKSTEELQKRFGELLDENVILKETLKQNNESMKEQFLLIASCQEDMMKTHMMHKEKFDETKELVEKLRQENKKLKQDMVRLTESGSDTSQVNSETGENKSGASSALEFVTSPDDDTINKLTAQLELVEKQRRQVIVENEKLTWQKESLEHIIDSTTKERDDLKEKLKNLELELSTKESEFVQEINQLKSIIQDLNQKLQVLNSVGSISTEEVHKRDAAIQQLEAKVSTLQSEFKNAQLRILELENVKLEFTKHKSGVTETVKIYKEQIQDLHNRLKEAQTTVFQPLRCSMSSERESTSDNSVFLTNVKMYDKTLKHISELFNSLINGVSDGLVHTLGLVNSLHDFKLEKTTADRVRTGLVEAKQLLEKEHSVALNNIGQIRSALSIFEGIFQDYTDLLKKNAAKQDNKLPNSANIESLTAALVARGQELQTMEAEVRRLKSTKEDVDLLKAQLDLYKSDFEAEREAREKMASEKETIMADLRTAQKRNQELVMQLEEVRKLNPSIYQNATTKRSRSQSSTATPISPTSSSSGPSSNTSTGTTGNMVYKCPKCLRFSSDQYNVMEDHFDFCLDDF